MIYPRRLTDLIKTYDFALSPEACQKIVDQFEADSAHHVDRDESGKRSFVELNLDPLPHWTPLIKQLDEAQDACVERYMKECFGAYPGEVDREAMRIKRYLPEREDVFAPHADGYDLTTSKRYLVLFTYLNDVEQGGETDFPSMGMRVKPKQGRIVIFPPFWMYVHAGLKPVSGPKYIVGSYRIFA